MNRQNNRKKDYKCSNWNKDDKYFYVFNDREMADIISRATRQTYMIFERHNGKLYSFENTLEVFCSYVAIKETRKTIQ